MLNNYKHLMKDCYRHYQLYRGTQMSQVLRISLDQDISLKNSAITTKGKATY